MNDQYYDRTSWHTQKITGNQLKFLIENGSPLPPVALCNLTKYEASCMIDDIITSKRKASEAKYEKAWRSFRNYINSCWNYSKLNRKAMKAVIEKLNEIERLIEKE